MEYKIFFNKKEKAIICSCFWGTNYTEEYIFNKIKEGDERVIRKIKENTADDIVKRIEEYYLVEKIK